MAISSNDVKFLKSGGTGSSGGSITATPITATKNDYWPDVSDAERIAGGSRFRKCFVENQSGTDALLAPVVWVDLEPTNCQERIGLGYNDGSDADYAQGNMTAWSGSSAVTLVSDGADTRGVRVYGVSAAGVPTTEWHSLNGTSPITTTASFSIVYGAHLESGAARIVLLKQSSTTRGTIGTNKTACWLWLDAQSKGSGLRLPDLLAGTEYGIWEWISWAANAGAVRPNTQRLAVEEA